MYPILLSFSTHFPILFINNSSIQNILSQDNLSQNKILLIFCVACFAGYFIAYSRIAPGMPRTVHTAPVIGLIPIPVMMSLAAQKKL